jgi:hypothetical protein
MRALAREQAAKAAAALQQQDAQRRRTAFAEQAGHLHHLVSTAARPGILRPPAAAATGALPAVRARTLEEHIRDCHREQARACARRACSCLHGILACAASSSLAFYDSHTIAGMSARGGTRSQSLCTFTLFCRLHGAGCMIADVQNRLSRCSVDLVRAPHPEVQTATLCQHAAVARSLNTVGIWSLGPGTVACSWLVALVKLRERQMLSLLCH